MVQIASILVFAVLLVGFYIFTGPFIPIRWLRIFALIAYGLLMATTLTLNCLTTYEPELLSATNAFLIMRNS